MNNIYSISRSAQVYFSENFLNSLTTQQKKIAAVAVAIFSSVILIYCFCKFKATKSKESLQTDLEDGRLKKVFKDGTIEIGEFKNEKLNGEGQRLFPDELIEESDDLERMEYPKGHSDIRRQIGTFKDGEFSGKGEILFWDGRVFTGTFVNGVLVEGTKRYSAIKDSNIDYTKGKFVNDMLDEDGEVVFKKEKTEEKLSTAAEVIIKLAKVGLLKDDANEKTKGETLIDDSSKKSLELKTEKEEKQEIIITKEQEEIQIKELKKEFPEEVKVQEEDEDFVKIEDAPTSDDKFEDNGDKFLQLAIYDYEKALVTTSLKEEEKQEALSEETIQKDNTGNLDESLHESGDKKVEEAKIVVDSNDKAEVNVFIRNGKEKYEINISLTDTILNLKEKINKQYDTIAIDKQRLMFGGKILKDDETLDSYNIILDSAIILAIKS